MFDPLLGGRNYDLPQLEREEMLRQQFVQQMNIGRPASPIWDEIDGIVDGLSDAEKEYLSSDEAYQESAAQVQAMLQREMMRHFKPIVEATKDGRAALDAHLSLVRKAQKGIKEEAAKKQALLNEYMLYHSDKSWNEFIESKQNKTKKK